MSKKIYTYRCDPTVKEMAQAKSDVLKKKDDKSLSQRICNFLKSFINQA